MADKYILLTVVREGDVDSPTNASRVTPGHLTTGICEKNLPAPNIQGTFQSIASPRFFAFRALTDYSKISDLSRRLRHMSPTHRPASPLTCEELIG